MANAQRGRVVLPRHGDRVVLIRLDDVVRDPVEDEVLRSLQVTRVAGCRVSIHEWLQVLHDVKGPPPGPVVEGVLAPRQIGIETLRGHTREGELGTQETIGDSLVRIPHDRGRRGLRRAPLEMPDDCVGCRCPLDPGPVAHGFRGIEGHDQGAPLLFGEADLAEVAPSGNDESQGSQRCCGEYTSLPEYPGSSHSQDPGSAYVLAETGVVRREASERSAFRYPPPTA